MLSRRPFSSLLRLATVLVILANSGCGGGKSEAPNLNIKSSANTPESGKNEPDQPQQLQPRKNEDVSPAKPEKDLFPEVVIVTNVGEIRVRLNAEKAPKTVKNFLENYVRRDFYSGTIFHYVDKGFMVAAGGYTPDLKPKPTFTEIRHEGDNGLKNTRGTIAMVRHAKYVHSATSQFFFNLNDNPSLDYKAPEGEEKDKEIDVEKTPETYGYCVFGEVVKGLEVLDKIAEAKVHNPEGFQLTPVEPIIIKSIRLVE